MVAPACHPHGIPHSKIAVFLILTKVTQAIHILPKVPSAIRLVSIGLLSCRRRSGRHPGAVLNLLPRLLHQGSICSGSFQAMHPALQSIVSCDQTEASVKEISTGLLQVL